VELEGLAGVIAMQGEALRAARLFATAASLREAAVAPLTGDARAATSKRLTTARMAADASHGDRLGRRQGDVPPEGPRAAHETN